MKKITLLLVSVVALLATAKAQTNDYLNCGTQFFQDQLTKNDPNFYVNQADLEAFTKKYIAEKTRSGNPNPHIIIPMVFHIIYAYGVKNPGSPSSNDAQLPPGQYGQENISDAQVEDAINVLNQDYNHANTDLPNTIAAFKGIEANCNFEFRLAKLDPYGNCTNGIEHIFSYTTFAGADDSKLDPWPRDHYLNVWSVVAIGTDGKYAGYAYYPSAVTNSGGINSPVDGVLIDNSYIGHIGTSNSTNRHALPHEVGHTMNLVHPWGGTNSPGISCGDDGVNDTPLEMGFSFCPGSALGSIYQSNGISFTQCAPLTFPYGYRFNNVNTASGTVDTGDGINANTGAAFSNFTAHNVSANSAVKGQFAFTNWDQGAKGDTGYSQFTGVLDTSKYYSVTVAPAPIVPGVQYILFLSGITFNAQRTTNGVRTFAVRSSVDGFTANLGVNIPSTDTDIALRGNNEFYFKHDVAISEQQCAVALSGTSYSNVSGPITFRFYGWNADSTAGTFGIDSVVFDGKAYQVENYQNFMDYSYCSTMFTNGQLARMQAALASNTSFRNVLHDTATLMAVGVYDTTSAIYHAICAPVADFSASARYACIGSAVNFYNASWSGAATGFSWTFSNATPATSTSQNPTGIVFNTAGWQTVTLTASNATGSNTITRTNFIYITDPNLPYYGGGFSESFEEMAYAPEFINDWVSDNEGQNNSAFTVINWIGYNSSHSAYLNSFGSRNQDVDALITPSVDLSQGVGPMYLNFKFAYATSQLIVNTNTASPGYAPLYEQLAVYYSDNCGATWTQISGGILSGNSGKNALVTAGYWSQSFVPTSTSDWVVKSLTLPAQALGKASNSAVKFKFEFTAGASSNNLYLDDINVSSFTAVSNVEELTPSIEVFPNPSNGLTTVSFVYNNAHNTSLAVTDVLGREVINVVNNANIDAGTHNYTIDATNLPKGIYIISLKTDGHIESRKLIVD